MRINLSLIVNPKFCYILFLELHNYVSGTRVLPFPQFNFIVHGHNFVKPKESNPWKADIFLYFFNKLNVRKRVQLIDN